MYRGTLLPKTLNTFMHTHIYCLTAVHVWLKNTFQIRTNLCSYTVTYRNDFKWEFPKLFCVPKALPLSVLQISLRMNGFSKTQPLIIY